MKKALASILTPLPSPEPQGKYPLYAASCAIKRANLLKFSIFTWGGGRAEKHEDSVRVANREFHIINQSNAPLRKATSLRGGLFVSALLTVVLVMLLCSCTKYPVKVVEPVETPTPTDLPFDTIYPGLSLDTAWLGDTTIYFDPIAP